jgi:undecaprenyl-diphosphatase
MNLIEAIILGIIQGLTEFLPVSSSGHLEIGKVLLGVNAEDSLSFTVAVHGATVLSTLVVFRKDIATLILGLLKLKWNEETQFIAKIFVSMIPVLIVGFFLKDYVEGLFTGNLVFVGLMLLVTASLLMISSVIKPKAQKPVGFFDSLVIGFAQAVAVIPGISRAGATISTGLILGNRKDEVARFSFLMVIIPILGANLLDVVKGDFSASSGVGTGAIIAGFVAAFIAGFIACKWMINIVKKGKLYWFALYCAIIGIFAIVSTFIF